MSTLTEIENAVEALSRREQETLLRHYANVRDELREARKPIPENDLWIAALARKQNLPVITRDAHFDHVPGLRRIGW